MRRKPRARRNEVEGFCIKVIAASAFVSRMEPDRRYPDGNCSSSIDVEGTLDVAVTGRTKAIISIHQDRSDFGVGAAIGMSATHWQVVVSLPEPQFSHVLALAANDKIDHCYVAVRGLRRGAGPIVSAGFHTAPVPYMADDAPA